MVGFGSTFVGNINCLPSILMEKIINSIFDIFVKLEKGQQKLSNYYIMHRYIYTLVCSNQRYVAQTKGTEIMKKKP